MLKNKIITLFCLTFSVFFIGFIYKTTDDISKVEKQLASSPNVLDATDLIKTQLLVTKSPLFGTEWALPEYRDTSWLDVKIPAHRLVEMKDYANGSFAYYRVFVPKSVTAKLSHLTNELFISFQYVLFGHVDIYINGVFYKSSSPKNLIESILNVPIEDGKDNVIAIKGLIQNNQTGIDHRGRIYIGKGAELNEMYRKSYKAMFVYPLIFILCKGSILFVFTLIFLLLKVHSSFEKFLMFGIFAVFEEIVAGDYLYKLFSLRELLYMFCFANIGTISFVFLFFEDLLQVKVNRVLKRLLLLALIITLGLMATDALFTSYYFSITLIMKAVTVFMAFTLAYFLPQMFKKDKFLFGVILTYIGMAIWSSFFSWNVGFNLKAYGNLSLFFVVAYQTFALFRREQEQLQAQTIQLMEQEKDVAIGKTAAFLAHDVRKPLELTKLLVDKMTTGEANKEFLEVARQDIESSINSVSGHIEDIINYSKETRLKLSSISLYSILKDSIFLASKSHPNVRIDFQFNLNAKKKVFGDKSKLQSALVNVINNAFEAIYILDGRSNGVIRFETNIEQDKFVLRIFNDGPLIPNDAFELIFKPLFTHGKSNGTGLGLASVQKIMLDHQGTIRAVNVSGGVEFVLEFLPSDEDDIPTLTDRDFAKSSPYEKAKEDIKLPPLRIFFLSTERSLKQLISLNSLYEVKIDFASDYESAKEFIEKKRYDLYLLDVDCFDINELKSFKDVNLWFLKNEVYFLVSQNPSAQDELLKTNSDDVLLRIVGEVYAARPKILLVEDSKLIRYAWQSYHGEHNITCVASPEDALAVLDKDEFDYDYCVLDFYFDTSSMTGLELASLIQVKNYRGKIIIASDADEDFDRFQKISKRKYDIRNF